MQHGFTPLLLLLIFLNQNCLCQISPIDTRDISLGNASVASINIHGIPKNLSLLDTEGKFRISCAVLNKYYIKDLSPVTISIVKGTGKLHLLGGMGRVGNSEFSENYYDLGISGKTSARSAIGFRIQYYQWKVNDALYSSSAAFIPEVSAYLKPSGDLSLGVIIKNPIRARMNQKETSRLPAEINSGIAWKVSDKFVIALSGTQRTDSPVSIQAGAEYSAFKFLYFRLGWNAADNCETLGIGIKMKGVFMDAAVQFNNALGNSSSLALNFQL